MKDLIVLGSALVALCACHPGTGRTAAARAAAAAGPASLYRTPPAATSASLVANAHVRVAGQAEPGSRVRLASPGGQAEFAAAGGDGVWRFDVAAPASPHLFGLAMMEGERAVQSEGYIAITPGGNAAQLRAGAGARVIGGRTGPPVIEAVDFDSKGGTVVSGRALPRVALDVWVDGVHGAHGPVAADGSFSFALDEPLSFSRHRLEIVNGSRRVSTRVNLTQAARLTGGPYRSLLTPSGWRIDWMTPGGGLQTTLLISHDGASA